MKDTMTGIHTGRRAMIWSNTPFIISAVTTVLRLVTVVLPSPIVSSFPEVSKDPRSLFVYAHRRYTLDKQAEELINVSHYDRKYDEEK